MSCNFNQKRELKQISMKSNDPRYFVCDCKSDER